jgi:N-dimethylarginine dimethylaminohydrolase
MIEGEESWSLSSFYDTRDFPVIKAAPNTQKNRKLPVTPTQLKVASFLMNFPFTISIDNPNNVWMEELEDDERQLDYDTAFTQFLELYNYISAGALVYLLPSQGQFQDQVYVANLGLCLPHLKDQNVVLLSNYKSEPRIGEDKVGRNFFKMMKYQIYQPPTTWEGEADLKYLRDNIYIGGYGIRTDPRTYKWMAEHFDMEIIPVLMDDEYLYHFDCLCFPLTNEKVMLGTKLLDPKDVKRIEKVAEIIDVPTDCCYNGITNSVRLENLIMCASDIASIEKQDNRYQEELKKVEFLNRVCAANGMEAVLFNLSEFTKSGAMLSCCVMHLNFEDYMEAIV